MLNNDEERSTHTCTRKIFGTLSHFIFRPANVIENSKIVIFIIDTQWVVCI